MIKLKTTLIIILLSTSNLCLAQRDGQNIMERKEQQEYAEKKRKDYLHTKKLQEEEKDRIAAVKKAETDKIKNAEAKQSQELQKSEPIFLNKSFTIRANEVPSVNRPIEVKKGQTILLKPSGSWASKSTKTSFKGIKHYDNRQVRPQVNHMALLIEIKDGSFYIAEDFTNKNQLVYTFTSDGEIYFACNDDLSNPRHLDDNTGFLKITASLYENYSGNSKRLSNYKKASSSHFTKIVNDNIAWRAEMKRDAEKNGKIHYLAPMIKKSQNDNKEITSTRIFYSENCTYTVYKYEGGGTVNCEELIYVGVVKPGSEVKLTATKNKNILIFIKHGYKNPCGNQKLQTSLSVGSMQYESTTLREELYDKTSNCE